MAITEVKIHPGIGIARVGNSPDEWFIGPETTDVSAIPVGGYKDAECRIKRQAARFRVFAYHDDGTDPTELTTDDATIEWTVEVANTKAGALGTDRAIEPGPRAVAGPNGTTALTGGSFTPVGGAPVAVDLGEIRTDSQGRLVVLGGLGTSEDVSGGGFADWYDDVSDGPVSADVTIDGVTFPAAPAWVVVAPPDFAPTVRPVISMYDRLVMEHVDDGLMAAPTTTSFLRDVHPILSAAVGANAVHSGAAGNHTTLSDSMYAALMPSPDTAVAIAARTAIVDRLVNAGGDMPDQHQGSPAIDPIGLTPAQFGHMERWRDGTFDADWSATPDPIPPVPSELDRGPVDHCVGSPLDPGMEIGPTFLSIDFVEPFRFAAPAAGGPVAGDLTRMLILPWQHDFMACLEQYWPSQRPGTTQPQAGGPPHLWTEGVPDSAAMVTDWHLLGFVVPEGEALVEVERCGIASITLLTPVLDFVDVPVGPGGTAGLQSLAIHFEVTTPGAAATFDFVSGATTPPFERVTMAPVVVGPTVGAPADAYLWVSYTTEGLSSSATETVEVEHVESGKRWTVELRGNTVARVTAGTVLVLDRSFSMSESRGDGTSKLVGLQEAVELFVAASHEGDGIGAVAFNQNVTGELGIVPLGPVGVPDPGGRDAVTDFMDGISPSGSTSIGDGLDRARVLLDAPAAAPYGRHAVVVVTDGKETAPLWIADVADTISATTYGVGIGTPSNVDVSTLQTLTGNHGGYLLLTGELTGDTQRRLVKYFLQILAGISNADVLLDPDGRIAPGDTVRIPFDVCDADRMVDVFVVTDEPGRIDVAVESPFGRLVDETTPDVEHVVTAAGSMLRIPLPVEIDPTRPEGQGRWTIVLTMPPDGQHDPSPPQASHTTNRRALDYSAMVNVYSALRFDASVVQATTRPGSTVLLEAAVGLGGAPIDSVAAIADVLGTNGTHQRYDLSPNGNGRFAATIDNARMGAHRIRVRALGTTTAGARFTREQTRTLVGELPGPNDGDRRDPGRLLRCLCAALRSKRARWWCRVFGIDLAETQRCLDARSDDQSRRS